MSIGRSLLRQHLFRITTLEFVRNAIQESLAVPTDAQCGFVRAILRKNITTNRVSGLFRQQRATLLEAWLADYVRTVWRYYLSDHAQWRNLVDRRRVAQIADVLAQRLDQRYGQNRLNMLAHDRDEVIHTVLLYLVEPANADAYTFDLPVLDWVDRLFDQCIWKHLGQGPLIQLMEVSLNQEYETLSMAALAGNDFEAEPSQWDTKLDIRRWMDGLPAVDRTILKLRLDGLKNDQIAEQISVSSKTVSNRLWKLQRSWRNHNRV